MTWQDACCLSEEGKEQRQSRQEIPKLAVSPLTLQPQTQPEVSSLGAGSVESLPLGYRAGMEKGARGEHMQDLEHAD